MPRELGFETIQFAPKFAGAPADPFRLVAAAKAAGFAWIAFDRHTLARQDATPGGLVTLAEACARQDLPCRVVQSLRVTPDHRETSDGFRQLLRHVEAFMPDVVPLILLAEPIPAVLAEVRELVARLASYHPGTRLALEWGPIFPVGDLRSARETVKRLDDERIGLVLDSWHVFTGATDWAELSGVRSDEIALVQLNDHGPLGGQSLHDAKNHRLLPGDGNFPLPRFLALLDELGFDGLLSVEVISTELRSLSVEQFARAALESSRRQFVSR